MTPDSETQAVSTDQVLIQLLTGAWAMQAVATAARLKIPDVLAAGPMTADAVAGKAGTDAGATYRLLRGLASLGVLERKADGRFALTAVGERLRADVPGTFRDTFIAESDTVHWRSWEVVADAVRTGRAAAEGSLRHARLRLLRASTRPRASSSARRCRTSRASPRALSSRPTTSRA